MHVMPESPKSVVEASTVLSSTKANFLSGDTQLLTTTSSTPAGMAPHAQGLVEEDARSCSPSKVWGKLPTYNLRSLRVAGFEGSCDAGVCSTQRNPSQNLPVFSAGSLPARAALRFPRLPGLQLGHLPPHGRRRRPAQRPRPSLLFLRWCGLGGSSRGRWRPVVAARPRPRSLVDRVRARAARSGRPAPSGPGPLFPYGAGGGRRRDRERYRRSSPLLRSRS